MDPNRIIIHTVHTDDGTTEIFWARGADDFRVVYEGSFLFHHGDGDDTGVNFKGWSDHDVPYVVHIPHGAAALVVLDTDLLRNDTEGRPHAPRPDAPLHMVGVTVQWFPGDDPSDPKGEQFENDREGWVAFAKLSDDTLSFPAGATPREDRCEALKDALRVRWDNGTVSLLPYPELES